MKNVPIFPLGILAFFGLLGWVIATPSPAEARHPVLRVATAPFWGPVAIVRNSRARQATRREYRASVSASCGGSYSAASPSCHSLSEANNYYNAPAPVPSVAVPPPPPAYPPEVTSDLFAAKPVCECGPNCKCEKCDCLTEDARIRRTIADLRDKLKAMEDTLNARTKLATK